MNSALLPLRTVLHLRKNSKCNTKGAYLSLKKTVNMSILYQNSGLTQSKVYYSNTRYQFCMNLALLPLRPVLHLRKNSKHCDKLVQFFSMHT